MRAAGKSTLAALVLTVLFIGCASVPKEIVELSYRTGQDIAALHESYDNLIHEFYDQLREQRITYLENRWAPRFVKKWIKNGELVRVAKGELVWMDDVGGFGAPSTANADAELLETVQLWADEAIRQIEKKRSKLLDPLYAEEDSLRSAVSQAFNQVVQANATITAHLHSLQEIKEMQDDALKGLGLHGFREQINGFLLKASERAAEGLERVKEIDEKVETVRDKTDEARGEGSN